MENNPRQFAADDLNGSDQPTGLTSHQDEPTTYEADDVTNEPTGNAEPAFSEAPQVETEGTVTVDKQAEQKVVSPPETTPAKRGKRAETA